VASPLQDRFKTLPRVLDLVGLTELCFLGEIDRHTWKGRSKGRDVSEEPRLKLLDGDSDNDLSGRPPSSAHPQLGSSSHPLNFAFEFKAILTISIDENNDPPLVWKPRRVTSKPVW
jgi:hypothetical protein